MDDEAKWQNRERKKILQNAQSLNTRKSLQIAEILPLYSKDIMIPPQGYGGIERSIAQTTAMLAATQGDNVTLYTNANSGILAYTEAMAKQLDLKYTFSKDGRTINIRNKDGKWGTVTLKSISGATDNMTETKALFDLLIADNCKRPYDIIHSHDKDGRYLKQHGIENVILRYHTSAQTFFDYYGPAFFESTEEPTYREYPIIGLSQSHAQAIRKELGTSGPQVLGYVYHGIQPIGWKLHTESAGYLLQIGRFREDKGAHRAIEIAKKSGKPLIIAGVPKSNKTEYYDKQIRPHIDVYDPTLPERMKKAGTPQKVESIIQEIEREFRSTHPDHQGPMVIFVGEVNDEQKGVLYGNADATLMPVSWPEPFGLVMIESMYTGTPVIGITNLEGQATGAIKEVIDDSITGFHVSGNTEAEAIDGAVKAVARLSELDRTKVQEVCKERFSGEQEVAALHAIFEQNLSIRPGEVGKQKGNGMELCSRYA